MQTGFVQFDVACADFIRFRDFQVKSVFEGEERQVKPEYVFLVFRHMQSEASKKPRLLGLSVKGCDDARHFAKPTRFAFARLK